MPKYAVTLPNGQTYEVASDRELSDAEAHQYATQQAGGSSEAPGFFESLLQTVNPMNAVRTLLHPIETAQADALNRVRNPELSVVKDAFPFTMGAGVNAGARIAHGDVRGGLGEAVGDVINQTLPAVVPEAPRGISATGRGLERFGAATKKPIGSLGAIEAVSRMDPAGLAIAAAPYGVEYTGKGLQRLGNALEGLKQRAFGAAASEIDRYMPNRGAANHFTAPEISLPTPTLVEPYAPNTGGAAIVDQPISTSRVPYGGASPSIDTGARIAGKAPTLSDVLHDALDAVRTDETPITKVTGRLPDTPSVRRLDELTRQFGKNADPMPAAASSATHAEAAAENVARNAPYGEGAILPSDMLPTELRDSSLDGLHSSGRVWDQDYGGVVPDFTFEAGRADVPGISADLSLGPKTTLADRVEAATTALRPTPAPVEAMPVETPAAAPARPTTGMGPNGDLTYTDWAKQMDDIINAATPEDIANIFPVTPSRGWSKAAYRRRGYTAEPQYPSKTP